STGTPVHDVGGASLTTLGVLAALWARDAMGVGQRIDVSLASSTLLLQCGEYTEFDGRPPAAHGGVDFLGPTAARRYYQASDEWIAVAAQTDSQFEALLQGLGVDGPCSLRDPADGALAEAMAKAIAGRTVAEWVAEFASAGVPAAPVVPHQHALDDEHLVLNEFSHVVMSNLFGRTRVMKRFADWSRSTVGEAVAAASKGEHGPEVLAEIGWDSEAISEALVQGTVLT
ncbi:MAG: L-carnitine dehydratase/bile acid-inducible protein, partial [Acidimicrobiia bacterium]|nr:L-carnitine dehydratase/bile acid-inducible protein [Acidimicrobiia bacterium]